MVENEYRFNQNFRTFVDEYCAEKGITVDQALKEETVRSEFRRYTEV